MQPDAFVAYYRNRDLSRRRRAWSAAGARQRLGTLRASVLESACRLQIPILEPACALSPTA
jgi:hypothetical protein